MPIRRQARRVCVVSALCAASCALIGCGSSARHAGSAGTFQSNPSPAMASLGQRSIDRGNSSAVSIDTNFRALHEDGARFFMLDRPSRLHWNIKPY